MTGLFFIFSNSVLVKINQISYNSHYVKWKINISEIQAFFLYTEIIF